MKILIWPGHHDLLDAAIKFLTHGKGCHAAFLRADGKTIHEAFYPRVRDRPFTSADLTRVECYDLEGVSEAQHQQFEHLFDAHLRQGIKYSIADLFRYALNRPCRAQSHTFCSRYVLHCCRGVLPDNLLPLVRIPGGDWASPRDLRISPRLRPSPLKAL